MLNNDIFRRLRYTFDWSDQEMIKIFSLAEAEVELPKIHAWLKKEDAEGFQSMHDIHLARFLNGFIVQKRGRKEGPLPTPEKQLNNNLILRKLKIALELKDDDLIEVLKKADFRISKPELSAFFRKPDHKHFRLAKDQVLRNFIFGLQLTNKPNSQ